MLHSAGTLPSNFSCLQHTAAGGFFGFFFLFKGDLLSMSVVSKAEI